MRGDEERVTAAFVRWLADRGWDVEREVDHVDVVARRGQERLLAEVKGRTASAGLDVDTAYGQLLRRMEAPGSSVRYALVVPETARSAALRVPATVREALRIDVYTVAEEGGVDLV